MALHRAAAPVRPDAQLTRRRAPAAGEVEQVRVALQRVVRRWQQLPLDHALRASGTVRALAQDLADETARDAGRQPTGIPDLGPATALDQLRVTAYDAQRAGLHAGLADRLAALLHEIR